MRIVRCVKHYRHKCQDGSMEPPGNQLELDARLPLHQVRSRMGGQIVSWTITLSFAKADTLSGRYIAAAHTTGKDAPHTVCTSIVDDHNFRHSGRHIILSVYTCCTRHCTGRPRCEVVDPTHTAVAVHHVECRELGLGRVVAALLAHG